MAVVRMAVSESAASGCGRTLPSARETFPTPPVTASRPKQRFRFSASTPARNQLTVNPCRRRHVVRLQLLVEHHVLHAQLLGVDQIRPRRIPAVERHPLRRRRSQHGASASAGSVHYRRVAGLHHHIEHQRAAPGAQVDLVSVVRLAPALADESYAAPLAGTVCRRTHAAWSAPPRARAGPGRAYTNSRPTVQLRVPPLRSRSCASSAAVGGRPPARRAPTDGHGSGRETTPPAVSPATASAPAPRRTTGGWTVQDIRRHRAVDTRLRHPIRSPAAWRPATARR